MDANTIDVLNQILNSLKVIQLGINKMYIFYNKEKSAIAVADSAEKFLEIWNEQYFEKFKYRIESVGKDYLWLYPEERHQNLLFEYRPIEENTILNFRY